MNNHFINLDPLYAKQKIRIMKRCISEMLNEWFKRN